MSQKETIHHSRKHVKINNIA